MNAFSVGWQAFMKDPESRLRDMTNEQRMSLYSQAWAYYRSYMFSTRDGMDWTSWLGERELYKKTRLIYNPVPSIVDFYVDNIWQRSHEDAFKEFETLVTPLTAKTDVKLAEAVAQLDQWGMWLAEATKIKRYTAATGNCLVEGVDDLERGKIYHRCIWPGWVKQFELNDTGDLQSYSLEYDVWDPDKKSLFKFRKTVTKDSYSYFRDDKPYVPPGKTNSVEPNMYGFIFAVWLRHTDDGSDYGVPACKNYDKVDNVNSLASHVDDFIHRDIESPKIIGASGEITPIIGAYKNKLTGKITPEDTRLNWVVLKVDTSKGAASVNDLSGVLKLSEASPELERQLKSFESDYPELQAATIMRDNSQLSGAALERMLGPAQNRLDGVQPGYNQQLIKLRQMQIAVAGMRVNGGGWSQLTEAQRLFKSYNLNSYAAGDLNFNLKDGKLVHDTESEVEDLKKKKADRAQVLLDVGIDDLEALMVAGYSEEDAQEIIDRKKEAEEDEEEAIANSGLLPPIPGQQRLPNPIVPPQQLTQGEQ